MDDPDLKGRLRKAHSELFRRLPPLPAPPRPIVNYTNCDECPIQGVCLASCPGGGFANLYSSFKRIGGSFPNEDVKDQVHALIDRNKWAEDLGRSIPVRRYFPPMGAFVNCDECFQLNFCRKACPAFETVYQTVKAAER
jgi:ferredoxin